MFFCFRGKPMKEQLMLKKTAAAEQSAWLVNLGITGKRFSKLPIWRHKLKNTFTLSKTNISPEKCWLEGYFSFGHGSFSGGIFIVGGVRLEHDTTCCIKCKVKTSSTKYVGNWFMLLLWILFFVCPISGVQYVPTRSQWLWAVGSHYTISIKFRCRNSLRANEFRLVNHASPRADHSLK